MYSTSLFRASLLGGLTTCLLLQGADWSRFRGPNGTGTITDANIPVKWTEKDQVFKVAIPGRGNSSPIVSNGKVFVHTSTDAGDARMLLCLDASTGKTIWTKTIPATKAHTHNLNTLASSTPAADGERVFCAFWDGKEVVLRAFDFKGNELWKHSLGSFGSQHGTGTSPVVYDGKVIFLHDQDKDKAADKDRASVLVCLDAVKGTVVWEKTRPAVRACYSSPFVKDGAGGKKELIVTTTPGITSYNLDDGKVNWNFEWKFDKAPLRTVGSALLVNDLVIATSGDGAGDRHTIAIKAGGQGSLPAKSIVWENKKNKWFPYVPCVVASGEYLFCVNDQGFASCLIAKDGKELWRERIGSNVTGSPLVINDKLYIPGEDGKMYVLEASSKYNVLSINDVGENIFATPAVADGKLYVRTRTQLVCIGKK